MQVQDLSVNDGEGIRTTIFLAGCPLRCAWCSNPEGQTLRNPMTRWAEAQELLEHVRHQAVFYRFSGGGVTFSGGEPFAQAEGFAELAELLKISDNQMQYVNNSTPGTGLLKCGNTIVPFTNLIPPDSELYKLITTKPTESIFGVALHG